MFGPQEIRAWIEARRTLQASKEAKRLVNWCRAVSNYHPLCADPQARAVLKRRVFGFEA